MEQTLTMKMAFNNTVVIDDSDSVVNAVRLPQGAVGLVVCIPVPSTHRPAPGIEAWGRGSDAESPE